MGRTAVKNKVLRSLRVGSRNKPHAGSLYVKPIERWSGGERGGVRVCEVPVEVETEAISQAAEHGLLYQAWACWEAQASPPASPLPRVTRVGAWDPADGRLATGRRCDSQSSDL